MSTFRKRLTFILPILAIVFAFIGYAIEGTDIYHAFLTSIKFIGTDTPLEPSNILIEFGRWCGIFFAASLFFALLDAILSRLVNTVSIGRAVSYSNSIAFHGDSMLVKRIAARCGKRAVVSDDPRAFKCNTQVILFSDDSKALEFYSAHANELASAERVIINLEETRADSLHDTNIHPLNLADICAQQYWMSHPAREYERILFIGEGSYANALITWGLLANVTSKHSNISYSIIGNFSEYQMLHERVAEAASLCGDSLVFLDGCWQQYPNLIRETGLVNEMGRIIVCLSPEESIHVASSLVDAGMCKRIHVHATSSACANLFVNQNGAKNPKEVVLFGTAEKLCDPEIILEEHHCRGAKIADLVYTCQGPSCNKCPHHPEFTPVFDDTDSSIKSAESDYRLKTIDINQCLKCRVFNDHWRNWSGFVRQSNYAVAVHDFQKVKLMQERGVNVVGTTQQECVDAYNSLPAIVRDELQEIEHLRWMRFHYLYNWRYAKTRNNQLRMHNDLLPYNQLPENEQIKDADAYKFLSMRIEAKQL